MPDRNNKARFAVNTITFGQPVPQLCMLTGLGNDGVWLVVTAAVQAAIGGAVIQGGKAL